MLYMPKNGTYMIYTKVTNLTGSDCRMYIEKERACEGIPCSWLLTKTQYDHGNRYRIKILETYFDIIE